MTDKKQLSERRRKEITALTQKKYRDQSGQFLVEGIRSVEAAVLSAAPLTELYVTEASVELPRVKKLLKKVTSPVYIVSDREIESLSDVETTQGVLAVAEMSLLSVEALLSTPSIVYLDGVQDPGNVGTVLRTAAWFGASAVVAGPGTADFFNAKVVRSAMGGIWDVGLCRCEDPVPMLAAFRSNGFEVYSADLKGTDSRSWRPRRPSVLILGSEAHGLSPSVRMFVHESVTIIGSAHPKGTESLNVAIATGILMYEWLGNGR